MLRIVHVDTGLELRGGQRQLLNLAHGLYEHSHQQLVVCPEESQLAGRARQEGFRVFDLPEYDPGHAHGIVQLRQQLRLDSPHILHAHDGRGQTLAWLASLGLPLHRVATRRVTFLPGAPARHRFIYARTCDAVIAISEYVRQLLIKSGVPAEKIEVIPDGIEIPERLAGDEDRGQTRMAWGFGEQEFLIGQVGAFTPEKGQDVALEAAAILAERLPEARLLLVGDAPPGALRRIEEVNRRTRGGVRLLGNLEELSRFFAGIDLFIMPSRAEGLGSAALQAMAHGRAVVASRTGGLPEIVEEEKNGWLVPPGSAAGLAEAIVAAAANRALLAQFGANARERARQFSSAIMRERTEALYLRLSAQGQIRTK